MWLKKKKEHLREKLKDKSNKLIFTLFICLFIVVCIFGYQFNNSISDKNIFSKNIDKLTIKKLETKHNDLNKKLKNLKLSKKAKKLGIPTYHLKNNSVQDYSIAYVNKAFFMKQLISKKIEKIPVGTKLIKIKLTKRELYFYKNKLYKKFKTKRKVKNEI